ncbi:MAG: dienelactone hydrolase family protein [Qipengyuania sp.]
MCTEKGSERLPAKKFDRRQFALLTGSAALAACTRMDGPALGERAAGALSESQVLIDTSDGKADGFFVHPATGEHPAVLVWPDIAGLRDAFRMMARRLAEQGYAVLVVNPYYRDVVGEQFADFAAFRSEGGFQRVGPWRSRLEAPAIMRDAQVLGGWLDAQEGVDSRAGIGTQGYCMGGPFTFWTAAAVPSRVRAAASFHGGGLVREGEASPHALVDETNASFLVAVAQDDHEESPETTETLREVFAHSSNRGEVEVYPADHGWTVPDSPAYDRQAAERAWARLLALYDRALG